jgi:hypothetical protein
MLQRDPADETAQRGLHQVPLAPARSHPHDIVLLARLQEEPSTSVRICRILSKNSCGVVCVTQSVQDIAYADARYRICGIFGWLVTFACDCGIVYKWGVAICWPVSNVQYHHTNTVYVLYIRRPRLTALVWGVVGAQARKGSEMLARMQQQVNRQ